MRIAAVLSALQEVHGAMAENVTKEVDDHTKGDQILYLLSVMMMLLGMVLMKVLQKCRNRWNSGDEEEPIAVRSMRAHPTGTSSRSRPTSLGRGATSPGPRTWEGPTLSRSRPTALEGDGTSATTRPTARSGDHPMASSMESMSSAEARGRAWVRSLDAQSSNGEATAAHASGRRSSRGHSARPRTSTPTRGAELSPARCWKSGSARCVE